MDIRDNFTDPSENATGIESAILRRKEQERIDFYNTYDVMTGVRIAATLGGFFGLMVLLVIYKSKSKTEKALEDPKLAAAAVAEAEEEERQIAAALEADAYEQLQPRRLRRSIDTEGGSVSPRWIRGTERFSSIGGGYATLLEPPVRLSPKIPTSIDEDSPTDDKFYDELYVGYADPRSYLGVPNRRASNVTCSSSGSSYLERRGSSVILPSLLPAHKSHQMRRRQSSPMPENDCPHHYYHRHHQQQQQHLIDIHVIQPTPGGSPCGSDRTLFCHHQHISPHEASVSKHLTPRAPLASISSCNSSLANDDYPDLEMQSYISDSVFHDVDEYYEDTDDEVEPFSTDSESAVDEDVDDDIDIDDEPCCSKDCYVRRKSAADVPSRASTVLPTISDESISTLVGGLGGSATLAPSAVIPLADSASCSNVRCSSGEPIWSKETLF